MINFIYVSFFFYGLRTIHCERLHEQIYASISGSNACFRRLNGTHQAGCSSPQNGAVGVVQMIRDMDDAKWLVTDAAAGPYMAIVNTSLFNNVIELFMDKPENIAGVLIYDEKDDTKRAMAFSLESRCPNEYTSDSESTCSSTKPGGSVWNTKGSGLLQRDIPFPILFSSEEHNEDIDKIEECYERYNKDKDNQRGRPLCSVQMNAFMFAAVSTELCMRRSMSTSMLTPTKVCDPIGDYNVYYSLFPRVQKAGSPKENVTLVTARIDAASLFDNVSPGAASSVVGLTTLVSTAILLSKMIPDTSAEKYDQNILFTFFNGEAFDYIGSQRVAYDISRGAWPESAPLMPESIKLHIEVGQIGGSLQDQTISKPQTKWPMYAFTPINQTNSANNDFNEEVLQFINAMSTNYNRFNESLLPKFTPNIPPSSIHSFRRILKNYTDTLPEIVLVDHDDSFTNMYYNSALDEYYQIGYDYKNVSFGTNGTFKSTEELISSGVMDELDMQVKISRLATALALTLYKRVVDAEYDGNLTASAHLIDEMLYCYTRNQGCPLMGAVDYGTSPDQLSPSPPYMYASVAHYASNPAVFTAHLLVMLTGTDVNADKTQCKTLEKPGYGYYWLKGWNHTGVCMQTSMNMSNAFSPAFEIEGYDLKSGLYSSWTESVWRGMSARLFVSAGGAGATAAAASGFTATAVAIFLTFWIKKHKDVVFVNAGTLAASDDATSGILRTVNC